MEGCFPDSEFNQESDIQIFYEVENGVIKCNQSLGPISVKMGIHSVLLESEGGKSAETHFIRLWFDPISNSSLVLCRLFTGRTHQIRVHLQYLGLLLL